MILVYLSLAVVIVAIVLFIVSVIQTGRKMRETMKKLVVTTEEMREKLENIAKEKEKLDSAISSIQLVLVCDKEKVQRTSRQVQQFVNLSQDSVYKVKSALQKNA